ncbi:hypothetical protein F2Q69_00018438 [Brassica cretica]|uniref:KRR-R motif-containing protein 1 n=1 Tax=Brassica cretica TaxID=69181 RepID=A0A8S9Q9T4_BRACR|nr:hypothetical protein F2Q69_00018438 [Brassica cretica]
MAKEYIDHWRIEKFDPAWNPTGMLEVSSFSRRYPHYIETYLQACWQSVQSALKEYGVACKLNVVEGSMTVSTTKKTRDPYIIVKARDLLRLLSRSVPAPQAVKILEDDMSYDIINIRKMVRKKERFVRRRQRLVGPDYSTLKLSDTIVQTKTKRINRAIPFSTTTTVKVTSLAATRRRLIRRRFQDSPPPMGKGKKKKGPRQGSPSSSSPPQSSSPPSNSRSKVNGSSAVPENSIETLNPPSSAFEHASDAQIVDLAAQQVQADMEKEASLPDSPKLASEALTGDSCPDLVAQQTDSISTQKSPSTKTLNLASDGQIIDSSSELAAQLDGETRLNESDSTTNNLEPVTATDSAAPGPGKKTRRGRSKSKSWRVSTAPKDPQQGTIQIYRPIEKAKEALKDNQGVFEVGGTSGSSQQVDSVKRIGFLSRASSATCSDVEHDSSDVDSSDSDKEEGR